MSHKVTANVGGAEIHIESGKIAKQADGAVTVQLGETIVLVAACGDTKPRPGLDFFPLTVDYREKAAAAGRFPGGFFKREGRPSEKEILTCRVTDRPIRPLFPKGYFNEVQIQTLLLSADGDNDSDVLSINGASAALMISDLPFAGPIGAVRVGRVEGEFVANPTHAQMEASDLDLVYVGNEKNMIMFEGSADELPEADFLAALRFGQESIAPVIAAQKELREAVGKPKREFTPRVVEAEVKAEAESIIGGRITDALLIQAKLEREAACNALKDEMEEKLVEKFGEEDITGFIVGEAFYSIQKAAVRKLVLDEGKRLDGRGFEDLRPLSSEAGMIPRTHGSGLFSRGETQGLSSNMRRASEMAHVGKIVQLGARGIGSARRGEVQAALDYGVAFHTMRNLIEPDGIARAVAELPEGVPVYIALDVDSMDPVVMPAVIGAAQAACHTGI